MVQRELCLNGFCGRGPDEGLGVPVGDGDVAGNRAFEVVDRAKDASFEALPSELGEEAFHSIEPGAGGRREVERPSRMFGELGVWSQPLMGHPYRVIRRMRYGPDSAWERHNDRGGPSSDTA